MNDTLRVEGKIIAMTRKALLLKSDGETPEEQWEFWVPKSVIQSDLDGVKPFDEVALEIEIWWLEQNGLA